MRLYFTILYCLLANYGISQHRDTILAEKAVTKPALNSKPEILSAGFIDIVQTGQMNASARLFKLYIGEPGKFQLPVSLYTGVSANALGNSKGNEDFVHHLINPSAGIFNLSFDGTIRLSPKNGKITSLQFQYAASIRLLSAYKQAAFKNITLFNNNESVGLMLITGAWERNRISNVGIFWTNLRAIFSISPASQMTNLFATPIKSTILGYSFGMGIEIYQAVNVKLLYYRYFTRLDPEPFQQPYFQASFNYSMR